MTGPARLNVVTLGVTDFHESVRFYQALGFPRKMKATGDEIAFFDAGGMVLALFPWDKLAEDVPLPDQPRPQAFRGSTVAWMCGSPEEVDTTYARAIAAGGRVLKRPHRTHFGGYSGYFADPDGHPWEMVQAPGFTLLPDGRVSLPE